MPIKPLLDNNFLCMEVNYYYTFTVPKEIYSHLYKSMNTVSG